MITVTISITQFEDLIKTKAKLESLLAYLNSEDGKYPKIEIIRAIVGDSDGK